MRPLGKFPVSVYRVYCCAVALLEETHRDAAMKDSLCPRNHNCLGSSGLCVELSSHGASGKCPRRSAVVGTDRWANGVCLKELGKASWRICHLSCALARGSSWGLGIGEGCRGWSRESLGVSGQLEQGSW